MRLFCGWLVLSSLLSTPVMGGVAAPPSVCDEVLHILVDEEGAARMPDYVAADRGVVKQEPVAGYLLKEPSTARFELEDGTSCEVALVAVDRSRPRVRIEVDPGPYEVGWVPEVAMEVSDNSGEEGLQTVLRLDGEVVASFDDPELYMAGTRCLEVEATDAAGNVGFAGRCFEVRDDEIARLGADLVGFECARGSDGVAFGVQMAIGAPGFDALAIEPTSLTLHGYANGQSVTNDLIQIHGLWDDGSESYGTTCGGYVDFRGSGGQLERCPDAVAVRGFLVGGGQFVAVSNTGPQDLRPGGGEAVGREQCGPPRGLEPPPRERVDPCDCTWQSNVERGYDSDNERIPTRVCPSGSQFASANAWSLFGTANGFANAGDACHGVARSSVAVIAQSSAEHWVTCTKGRCSASECCKPTTQCEARPYFKVDGEFIPNARCVAGANMRISGCVEAQAVGAGYASGEDVKTYSIGGQAGSQSGVSASVEITPANLSSTGNALVFNDDKSASNGACFQRLSSSTAINLSSYADNRILSVFGVVDDAYCRIKLEDSKVGARARSWCTDGSTAHTSPISAYVTTIP